METLVNKRDKIDIKEFLNDYSQLKKQYLFFDCFIISSDNIMYLYQRAKKKENINFKNVEIYYTPKYLFNIKRRNQIFDIINRQKMKKFYYLREHIFYYQYLLQCLQLKKEMEKKKIKMKKEEIDTSYINEISYRTLLNRLYLLCDQPNLKNNNYGISEIFGVPCIYSIMEPNIIEQIMNMKKFSYELMQMKENKVIELFGMNFDLNFQSNIYNKLLITISGTNSTIQEENNSISDGIKDDLNKINKNAIEMENFLINISSELFLFHYITNQFDKNKLIQIPRMIFFCCLYNYDCKNIYEIYSEKKNERKKEEEKKFIQENPVKIKTEVKKEIKDNKGNKKKESIKEKIKKETPQIPQKNENQKVTEQTSKKRQEKKQDKNKRKEDKIEEIEKKEKQEKYEKNLLKCKMMNFVGTLEIDGAFKYIGEEKEIEAKSLVFLMSEYIFGNNKNIKSYAEKYEAKGIIKKLDKYKNNITSLKASLKKNKIFKIDVEKEPINLLKKKYEEIANRKIISKNHVIKKNDIILLENKREFPNHISDEVYNFIDHSLYFISLYENLKLLEKTSEIHLLFVYDHSRNYNDEGLAAIGLYNFINENSEKLSIFKNKIKFHLIHSLPNLSISPFDKFENNNFDLNKKNNILTKTIENQNSKISDLTKENKSLKEKDLNMTNENKNLKDVINNLETEVRYLKNEIKKQIKITKEFDDRLAILEKEMKQLRAKKKKDIGKNQVNDKNINK